MRLRTYAGVMIVVTIASVLSLNLRYVDGSTASIDTSIRLSGTRTYGTEKPLSTTQGDKEKQTMAYGTSVLQSTEEENVDEDYETLLRIVEAEAGGEDVKGRMLVANVILNRVESREFPDLVRDVVWQKIGGSAQFSPTEDGRINTVAVSDLTKKAVDRVINGEDESQGALYFMARSESSSSNVQWFDTHLQYLFSYGGHEFYK